MELYYQPTKSKKMNSIEKLKSNQPELFETVFNTGVAKESKRINNWLKIDLTRAELITKINSNEHPSEADLFYAKVDKQMKQIK